MDDFYTFLILALLALGAGGFGWFAFLFVRAVIRERAETAKVHHDHDFTNGDPFNG